MSSLIKIASLVKSGYFLANDQKGNNYECRRSVRRLELVYFLIDDIPDIGNAFLTRLHLVEK